MKPETDFLDLYAELGLRPDCSLDEFKHAYRRRLAALHPDRHIGATAEPPPPGQLQRLTAMYGAAMDFHRRYGRLPGARQGSWTPPQRPDDTTQRPPRRRWRGYGVAALAVIALAWLYRKGSDDVVPEPTPVPITAPAAVVFAPASAPRRVIRLGMSSDEVLAIEGTPVVKSSSHWEYGPSWVRFEDGKVVDWYSSALRPLTTEGRRIRP